MRCPRLPIKTISVAAEKPKPKREKSSVVMPRAITTNMMKERAAEATFTKRLLAPPRASFLRTGCCSLSAIKCPCFEGIPNFECQYLYQRRSLALRLAPSWRDFKALLRSTLLGVSPWSSIPRGAALVWFHHGYGVKRHIISTLESAKFRAEIPFLPCSAFPHLFSILFRDLNFPHRRLKYLSYETVSFSRHYIS